MSRYEFNNEYCEKDFPLRLCADFPFSLRNADIHRSTSSYECVRNIRRAGLDDGTLRVRGEIFCDVEF